jgi:predicted metalloprotease
LANELLITLVVALAYLALVRFMDLNEREPVWALAIVFGLGAAGACLANLLLGSARLTLPIWSGAFAVESTKLLSLATGIQVLKGIGRTRGWSEFSDLTDGLVYGITVGLGYSVGETFVRELATAEFLALHLNDAPIQAIWRAGASGLSHGVFGALLGLGCGAVLELRGRASRTLSPLLGLGAAVVLDALFRIIAHGDALGGRSGLYRAWLVVLVPFVALLGVGLLSLTVERRAIRAHLTAEPGESLISESDLQYLGSFWRRQGRYLGLLMRGQLATALRLSARHNRQVQLALLLRRLAREPDPERSSRLTRQAELIRAAIRHARPLAVLFLLLAGAACADRPVPNSPSDSTPSASPETPAPATPAPAPPGVETASVPLDSLLQPARRDLDGYWRRQLGAAYRSPDTVIPYSPLSFDCPLQRRNARWCPSERRIYYDPDWFESFRHEAGDYAPVFVLAHEWGHLVQDLRGDLDPKAGLWQLQIELQADCLAGQWTRDAAQRGAVKPAAEDQAMSALRRLRDPVDYPWFRADAHGDAGQRIGAYLEGDEGRTCTGAEFWKRVRVDSLALRQPPTPSGGSMIDDLACRAGRFERVSVFQWPEALSSVVTDAIQATFKSQDGVAISYWSIALVTAPAAQARLESFIEQAVAKGYQVTKEGPVSDSTGQQIGEWNLLSGPDEMVVIRNGQKLTAYEGPAGAAWEFGTATLEFTCK